MKNVLYLVLIALFTVMVLTSSMCNLDPDPPEPTEELGTVLWIYDEFDVNPVATEPVSITGTAVGQDGIIFVATYDRIGANWQNGRVHAINSDSTFRWASPELENAYPSDPVIGLDGAIYVICGTSIYALNPGDGSFIWTYQPPAETNEQHDIGWLTLGNEGQIFFAHIASGAYERKIYALNSNGTVLWKQDVNWGANNLAVGTDGTLFAYWQANGDINTWSAFNTTSGIAKWSKVAESYPRGVAISPDGNLVISQDYPDKLIKRDAANGEIIWDIDAPDGYPSITPDGSIYLVSSDLYCYNPDGTLKWETGSYVGGGSKIAIDSEGSAYGSITDHGDGNFQVYKSDGTLRWAIYQPMTTLQCPAIGPNNVVYVTVSSNPKATIYAIRGDKPLASSGWPRDTGGNANSRNVNVH